MLFHSLSPSIRSFIVSLSIEFFCFSFIESIYILFSSHQVFFSSPDEEKKNKITHKHSMMVKKIKFGEWETVEIKKKLLIQKKLVLLSALFKQPNNFIEFWIFHNYVNQNHKRKNMKSAFQHTKFILFSFFWKHRNREQMHEHKKSRRSYHQPFNVYYEFLYHPFYTILLYITLNRSFANQVGWNFIGERIEKIYYAHLQQDYHRIMEL